VNKLSPHQIKQKHSIFTGNNAYLKEKHFEKKRVNSPDSLNAHIITSPAYSPHMLLYISRRPINTPSAKPLMEGKPVCKIILRYTIFRVHCGIKPEGKTGRSFPLLSA